VNELLRKELRALRPFFWLVAVLSVLDVGYEVLVGFPDSLPLEPSEWLGEDRVDAVLTIIVVAIMTAAGLLVNEEGQGTLAFLDGLPVSRTRIFAAKISAASTVLLATVLTIVAADAGFGWLSQTSTSGPFPWRFLWFETGLLAAVAIHVFAFALLLSFLRRWLLLAVGIAAWILLWARTNQVAHSSLIDPFELARMGLDGEGGLIVPWRHVAVQATAAAAWLMAAWLGFCGMGDRGEANPAVWRRILVWLGWAAVPVVWIVVVDQLVDDDEEQAWEIRERHPGGERDFGREKTDNYEFVFREDQRDDTLELIEKADEIHDIVSVFFGSPPSSGRIVVDLAGNVPRHVAGQAHWKKIHLPLALNDTIEAQRQVLGHETTHVVIDIASEGRAMDHFSRTRWFHEGLATYVEVRHFDRGSELEKNNRSAAAAHAWHRVSFDDLCDDSEWSRRRPADLVYPVGRLWCESLVGVHGDAAPGLLTRALARPEVRTAKSSAASWRAAVQACGFELETVNAAFDAALAAILAEHQDWIDTLPRVSISITVGARDWLLDPAWDGTAPGELMVRVRPSRPDASDLDTLSLRPGRDGIVRVPRSQCPGPTIWHSAGWLLDETRVPVLEDWVEAPAPQP
jgi:hypothetical protein